MAATMMTTTAPDYDAIVRVVQLYIDACNGDVDTFKEAFHEDAWIFCTDAAGVLHKDLLSRFVEGWTATDHIEGRVLAVTQAGDVATVLLGWDNRTVPSDSWVDVHALLRIDGVWKITNKTATHSSRAGGR